jgi:hypothetical protein
MTYRIIWEVELDADNPLEAAKEALDYIIYGEAIFFEVWQERDDKDNLLDKPVIYGVDLLEGEDAVFLIEENK